MLGDDPASYRALPFDRVGGTTAQGRDFVDAVYGNAPLVLGLIVLVTLVLLIRAFRSVVLAIKAVILNVLSVAATYGLLVLAWQDGRLSERIWGIDATRALGQVEGVGEERDDRAVGDDHPGHRGGRARRPADGQHGHRHDDPDRGQVGEGHPDQAWHLPAVGDGGAVRDALAEAEREQDQRAAGQGDAEVAGQPGQPAGRGGQDPSRHTETVCTTPAPRHAADRSQREFNPLFILI